ncbi:MAG: hypothetical protein ACOX6T_21215 [Myxococcales bacterium]
MARRTPCAGAALADEGAQGRGAFASGEPEAISRALALSQRRFGSLGAAKHNCTFAPAVGR